jgi:signal transduction histidine kinase/CHASE3 domain sensor protein
MAQISQANFKRRLALALALPLLLMSILAVSLIGQVSHLTSVMQWVDHTDRVIAQANYTQKLLVDMETGLRGYLVTGNSEFLQPYQQASLAIAPAFDQLGRMTSDNPLQVQRLSKLRSQYEQWNRYAQQMMALKKQGGNYQAYAINAQGKTQMDTMRGEMASFIQTEEALRNNRTQTAQKTTQLLFVSRTVLSLGVGGIMAFFIRRQLIAVAQSYARALAVAQEQTETLRESEAALRRSAQRLADLHQIDRSILQAQSLEVLIHAALSRLRKLVPYQQAFVVLFNFETATAQVVARIGNGESNLPEGTTMPIEDFVPSEVLQQITHDLENVPVFESCPPIVERLADGESRSCLTVPLRVEDSLMGEISFIANQVAGFAPENQQIIQEVAAQLAIAIQQSKLREQLQNYAAELEQRVADRTNKLQEVNAELEAFSYSVSHDLRAPLRTLQGFTQALLEDYGDQLDPIGQDYTRYIAQAAVSMDTLISDLLAYSRLSRADIQIQPIDLSTVMAEVLRQLNVELRELQALVTVEESLPQVMAHRRTLVQVLTNLLTNAIKFVKPEVQPQLRVWAEERGSRESELGNGDRTDDSPLPTPHSLPNWVRLWVEDNGIGIAPEYQDRIFRVFERLHGVETYPGTGIGLAIVRKGIERMGGRVGVVSQPDKGSRFWIELPKASR